MLVAASVLREGRTDWPWFKQTGAKLYNGRWPTHSRFLRMCGERCCPHHRMNFAARSFIPPRCCNIWRRKGGPAPIHPMVERTKSESFDELVEWAYSTLPREIRVLRDFPGIQVLDEPPEAVTRRNRVPGTETLGLFSGIHRTQQRHDDVMTAPNLIFVFRGPIQRCSRGDLRAEVKKVVWHEVAHWLGHDEDEVEQLGLGSLSPSVGNGTPHKPESRSTELDTENTTVQVPDGEVQEPSLRCIKCYSADITRREVDKFVTPPGAWLREPVRIRMNICTCRSCGYEWDDGDNG